jgi:D-sedoheptulose 7-phosphate isomerase
MRVIGLTGTPESPLHALSDVCICSPGGAYADRVQEMHIKIIHILLELVERDLFPENYVTGDVGD